jgi:trimeric autotransporter adhesin
MQSRLRIVGLVGLVAVCWAIAVAPATAAPPVLDISPSPGHFGKQPVGTTTVQTFTITNTSSEPVTINSATIVPALAFGFTNLGCVGTTLALGASCTIDVSFTPTATQWYRANFCVNGATGALACTKLSGRGI